MAELSLPDLMSGVKLCCVTGCGRKHWGRGFCQKHYAHNARFGDPVIKPTRPLLRCNVAGCNEPYRCSGYCRSHYSRFIKHGTPNAGVPLMKYGQIPHCTVPGCSKKVNARGLCSGHYTRLMIGGDLRIDVPLRQEAKGTINPEGYRIIPVSGDVPNARRQRTAYIMFEHRYVMQQMLGRGLLKEETVHHINGDRSDNRPENLELWVKSHPRGQRVEDHLVWAREIIRRYGDLVEQASVAGKARKQ